MSQYQRALDLVNTVALAEPGAEAIIAAAQVYATLAVADAITEHPVVAGEAERAVRGEGVESGLDANRGPDRGPSGTPPGMGGPTTGPRDEHPHICTVEWCPFRLRGTPIL